MPYNYSLNMLPMGRSLNFALEGETVEVQTTGFLTSEDGTEFLRFAEGLSAECPALNRGRGCVPESQVDHLLTIVRPDRTAIAYCNELRICSQMRSKRVVKAGQEIYKSDVADILRLKLETQLGEKIIIPPDCGVAFLFSAGWRKGVFFDYEPLCPEGTVRSGDVEVVFGRLYGRLLFSEFYALNEPDWDQLFDWGLFPFAAFDPNQMDTLIVCAKRNQLPPAIVKAICDGLADSLASKIEEWDRSPILAPHIEFARIACSHYLRGDYLSSIQVLYPRIEGVLRECLSITAPLLSANQANLARYAGMCTHEDSLLLPRRFERYLLRFYFRNFDVKAGATPLSRNSIAHGVAKVDDFDPIKAAIGFLILDQVFFYAANRKPEAEPELLV